MPQIWGFLFLVCAAGHYVPLMHNRALRSHQARLFEDKPLPTKNFTNLVDHFGSSSAGTYQQRYFVNSTFDPTGTGPVFLYLGGEGPMEAFVGEAQMFVWAAEFQATYILLEHRYYGASSPSSDYSPDNLKYLTSRQALADAANFIRAQQAKEVSKRPWIIFGCSYSGCLSGWFRMLYPDLVLGAYAPSGPVLAQANFTGYNTQFFDTGGKECSSRIEEATAAVAEMFEKNIEQVSKLFNTCAPLLKADADYFFWTVMMDFSGLAQSDLPELGWPVKKACDNLLNTSVSALDAFVAEYRRLSGDDCSDFKEASMIADISKLGVKENNDGGRSWWYQTCTEFGYYQVSYPGTSPFFPRTIIPVEYVESFCKKSFGITFDDAAIRRTNAFYGGFDLNASKVIVTQGRLDPWHRLGITESRPGVEAVMYDSAHCSPLHEASPADPQSLKDARVKVGAFIRGLLSEAGTIVV